MASSCQSFPQIGFNAAKLGAGGAAVVVESAWAGVGDGHVHRARPVCVDGMVAAGARARVGRSKVAPRP